MKNVDQNGAAHSLAQEARPTRPHGRITGWTLALAFGTAVLAPCFASCSFVKPEVGKFRGSCTAGGSPGGGSGGYAGYDAGAPGDPDPRCTPAESDEPCAICEDTHCCGTRFGCYDDSACACADEEFDGCLEEIADPTSEEGVAATTHCWDTFSGSDARAKARVACQREFCKDECGVP
jgi:hypothetical protein